MFRWFLETNASCVALVLWMDGWMVINVFAVAKIAQNPAFVAWEAVCKKKQQQISKKKLNTKII